MKKKIAFSILGLLLVIGVLGGVKTLQIKDLIAAGQAAQVPPTAVAPTSVEQASWETTLRSIGTMEAAQGVMVTADVSGRVAELAFDGGESVQKGDVLLAQETTTEEAQLSAAESDLALAESNQKRVKRLYDSKVISQSEYDATNSALNAAKAQLANIKSVIQKKRIVAPFSGRLGLRMVDIGQDLGQGVPIVSLQATDKMRVNFSLPQQALSQVRRGLDVRVSTDAVPGKIFLGQISAINTEIDESTRTVKVQAAIGNQIIDDQPALLPGMFASVEVVLNLEKEVLMIPLTAVNFATYGDSVFVLEEAEASSDQGAASAQSTATSSAPEVASEQGATAAKGANQNLAEPKLKARQQFVQLGERRGDFVEVTKGLEAGQQLANDGVFKLRNGASVILSEGGKKPSLTPNPDNA